MITDKELAKLQKMYGPDHNDFTWYRDREFPKLPVARRAWLRVKRVASYKVW